MLITYSRGTRSSEGGRRRRGRRGGRRRRRQEGAAAGEATDAASSRSEIDFDDEDSEGTEGELFASDSAAAAATDAAPVSNFASAMPVTSAEADFDDLQLDLSVPAPFEPAPVASVQARAQASGPVVRESFAMPVAPSPMQAPAAEVHLETLINPATVTPMEVRPFAVESVAHQTAPLQPTITSAPMSFEPSPTFAPREDAVAASAPIHVSAPIAVAIAPSAPAAGVADAPTAADAAAMVSSDIDDDATLAAAGNTVEGIPAELTSPPLGSPPAQVESEGEARNSPMV